MHIKQVKQVTIVQFETDSLNKILLVSDDSKVKQKTVKFFVKLLLKIKYDENEKSETSYDDFHNL